MAKIRFTKAVATGNDFVVIDNRKGLSIGPLARFAREVCNRNTSVGADGLLLLERSKKADFRMRIINRDGSEAQMCGNGSRCAALYAFKNKIVPRKMTIDTLAGLLSASVEGELVRVRLMDPKDIRWNFCLTIANCPYKVSFLNSGVPHTVHFVSDLDSVDVKRIGSDIRYHSEFSPEGTNADFVKILNDHTISIRTYERGVEDETLACGTGAVASALISAESEKMSSPVTVRTQSGEKLKVYFSIKDGQFKDVYLEGTARLVFDGVLYS